jgi:glycosyltransferase involved in cell wall biosynthesis
MYQNPCPKICVSRWLVEVGRQKGVPTDELVHVSNGLNHAKYRVVAPIETRPPLIATTYRANRQTRPEEALAVLSEVKRRIPEMEAVLFSPAPPEHDIMPWVTVMTNPAQELIVNDIYNRSQVFLCTSRYEGFGFPSVEAMACGAALVTAANGGSDDYAVHDETALVCEPDDVMGMADQVERLLRDDELRFRLARRGGRYVRETFDWDASAAKLEAFLGEYAADPRRYTRR